MAHRKYDLVQETSISTGAGALALLGAATRRRTFGSVLANADTCYVLIENASAAEWQVCLATYATSGNTLTPGTILASSTGSAVSFSPGTKTISLVAPAAKSIVEDANGDASITRNLTIGSALYNSGPSFLSSNLVMANATYFYTPYNGSTDTGTVRAGVQLDGTSQALNFYTAGTYRGGFGSTGYLGVGGVATYPLDVQFTADSVQASRVYNLSAGASAGVTFSMQCATRYVNRTVMYLGQYMIENGNGIVTRYSDFDTQVFRTTAGAEFLVTAASAIRPGADNAATLGHASYRWSVVYSATAAINTSERAAKVDIGDPLEAERRAARRILEIGPRRYRLKESVEEKGDAARVHFGYVAEDVRDALAAEGLDPWQYAFLCSDAIVANERYTETRQREKRQTVKTLERRVEMVDGRAVQAAREIEREEPVGRMVPVQDEEGRPVFNVDEAGAATPAFHFVPEVEDYEEELTREVATGEVRLGLRYSELEAFLRCAA